MQGKEGGNGGFGCYGMGLVELLLKLLACATATGLKKREHHTRLGGPEPSSSSIPAPCPATAVT